jgi:hypothetical protein
MSRKRLHGEANVHFAPIVSSDALATGTVDAAMAEACPIFGNCHKTAGNNLLLMIGKAGNLALCPCVTSVSPPAVYNGPTVSSTC